MRDPYPSLLGKGLAQEGAADEDSGSGRRPEMCGVWRGGLCLGAGHLPDERAERRSRLRGLSLLLRCNIGGGPEDGGRTGHPTSLVTGDRRLHAKGLEEAARRLGVRHVAIPWTSNL